MQTTELRHVTRRAQLPPQQELALAAREFQRRRCHDSLLKSLFLVDPIQAFADGGIVLSKRARKLLRRIYPGLADVDEKLYQRVKTGAIRLPWIEGIDLGTAVPVSVEQGEYLEAKGATV
jgi:hypothetical protein